MTSRDTPFVGYFYALLCSLSYSLISIQLHSGHFIGGDAIFLGWRLQVKRHTCFIFCKICQTLCSPGFCLSLLSFAFTNAHWLLRCTGGSNSSGEWLQASGLYCPLRSWSASCMWEAATPIAAQFRACAATIRGFAALPEIKRRRIMSLFVPLDAFICIISSTFSRKRRGRQAMMPMISMHVQAIFVILWWPLDGKAFCWAKAPYLSRCTYRAPTCLSPRLSRQDFVSNGSIVGI